MQACPFMMLPAIGEDLYAIVRYPPMEVAHTPDPDDSFMFYGMFEGKIKVHHKYGQVIKDIEALNQDALSGKYEVTAMSAPAYARVPDKYFLTSSGASFGISYGPIVIARKQVDLANAVVGSPGELTSSHNLYRMFMPEPRKLVVMKFDQIVSAVLSGKVDAGIIIHDEQLTYQNKGLVKVADLFKEWSAFAPGLPIPLGFNAISRNLSPDDIHGFMDDFRRSIDYGLEHEDDALSYSMKYARYSDFELERRFVKMYVNKLTRDFGSVGRAAIEKYFDRADSMDILKKPDLQVV